MTIELGWWAIPLIIIIVGAGIAQAYHKNNYSPSGYFGDPFTPFMALIIFGLFAVMAVGIVVGKLFF